MKNNNSLASFDSAIKPLTANLKQVLRKITDSYKSNIQEIRLRSFKAVCVLVNGINMYVCKNGKLTKDINEDLLTASHSDIINCFHSVCNYSVYSHQNEIKNGFVTFKGGHRVGVAGCAVINDGKMSGIRDIFSLNIRVAKEFIGAADELLYKLGKNLDGILIAGKPACGKTTLLRDIARQLSLRKKISVVDQRGEIASVCAGISYYNLGNSDILTGYPKEIGILQSIRCLSPDIIICDEIGTKEETLAIEQGLNAGVGIIASVHCSNMEELRRRPQIKKLLSTGAFDKVVLMSDSENPGKIKGIYKIGDYIA